jgi:PAS domain-containing protein
VEPGRAWIGSLVAAVPYFICPNCKERSVDIDGLDGFTNQAAACRHCGFGFLFELLEDYYPAPSTGLVVCDAERRVLSAGRGVFELSGYEERDLLGRDVTEAFGLEGFGDGGDPAAIATEWGVRRLGERLVLRTRAGLQKPVTADFFPAYDSDGGLLVALTPRSNGAAA